MNATLFGLLRAADHAAEANVAFSKTIGDLDGSLLAAAEEWRASSGYVIAKQESLPRAYNAAAIDFANKIQAVRADAAGHPDMIALIEKVEPINGSWLVCIWRESPHYQEHDARTF